MRFATLGPKKVAKLQRWLYYRGGCIGRFHCIKPQHDIRWLTHRLLWRLKLYHINIIFILLSPCTHIIAIYNNNKSICQ